MFAATGGAVADTPTKFSGATTIEAPPATPAPVTLLLNVIVVGVTAVANVLTGIFVPAIRIPTAAPVVEVISKTFPAAVGPEVITVIGFGIPA